MENTAQNPQELAPNPLPSQVGLPPNQPMVVIPNESRLSKAKLLIIIIVLFVLIGLGAGAYLWLKPSKVTQVPTPTPSPTTQKSLFYTGTQTASLSDGTGGSPQGTVTREISGSSVTHVVSATLAEPEEGKFYQVWLYKTPVDQFPIGKLIKNDAGEFTLNSSYAFDPTNPPPDLTSFKTLHNTVVVSLEGVDDLIMETEVLEATFSL